MIFDGAFSGAASLVSARGRAAAESSAPRAASPAAAQASGPAAIRASRVACPDSASDAMASPSIAARGVSEPAMWA